MEYSSRKGIRIFLAALLSVSLLGTSGMQMFSEAFASEGDDAVEPTEQQMASSADNTDESEPTSTLTVDEDPEASPSDEADSLDSQQPDNASWRLVEPSEDLETTEESADLVEAQSISVPETRYVYEYVYGIIGSAYAVASDIDDVWSYWRDGGTLLSATQGAVLEEGVTVLPRHVGLLSEGWRYIPFNKDGLFGLYDFSEMRVAIEPCYEISMRYSMNQRTDSWGFIRKGAQSEDGTFPKAEAVIYAGEAQVYSYPLEGYKGSGSIEYWRGSDLGHWTVEWSTKGDNIANPDRSFQLTDDFQLLSSSGKSYITPDGYKVVFGLNAGGSAMFAITNPGETKQEWHALETDQTDIWNNFRTVSNLIEVRSSNGFSYQYFMLDGTPLQNFNDKRFQELGNYVSYDRVSFDEKQERTQVFLDTSDECREAKEIPALKSSFITLDQTPGPSVQGSHPTYFECITPDNKIQRYDAELNLIQEFATSLNMKEHYENGYSLSWSLTEPFEDTWLITEIVRFSNGSTVVDSAVRLIKGNTVLDHSKLGLASPSLLSQGTCNGYLYLVDDSGSYKMRLYQSDLSLFKEIDLSSYIPSNASSVSINLSNGLGSYGPSKPENPPKLARISISYWTETEGGGSSHSSKSIILDSRFGFTEYSSVRYLSSLFAAEKDGKWGFVDADLNPLSEFVYDQIYTKWNEENVVLFSAFADNKERVFDQDLNDVFGVAFDTFKVIGNDAYLLEYDGDSHIYIGKLGGDLKEVSLRGYKPVMRQGPDWRTARDLPNGSVMLYLQDADGKIGAIDDAGRVIIPFEYENFAEDTGTEQDSDYIMLKDADGWFFVAVTDLQPSAPHEDCSTLGHDYKDVAYPATCTTNGYIQHVCQRCGYAYRDEASGEPTLGHDYVLTSEAVDPTCTEDGHEDEFTCSRCGAKQGGMRLPNLGGHAWTERKIIAYPTCTEDGMQEYTCTKCGELIQEALPAYGHSWSEPEWTWSDDFQSATARITCIRGCGEHQDLPAEVTHEQEVDGMRHSAQVTIGGIAKKDGRLTLGWTDANGIMRSLLVKGAPVADGFTAWPQGLVLPSDAGKQVEIDVVPVSSGGVFDALVSKIGDGWPAGTFDVRLNVDGEETHEGFGSLTFAFPGGPASPGKKAVIHHCHKDDRANITSHESFVTSDGKIILGNIVDLSTFALEVLDDDAFVAGTGGEQPTKNQGYVGGLAQTGDETMASVLIGFLLIYLALFSGIAAFMILKRRKSNARR